MRESELAEIAVRQISRLVQRDGPAEPRVLNANTHQEWDSTRLRHVSVFTLHVLERSTDLVIFFDGQGNLTGWRDDGRRGSLNPATIDRDAFRVAVVSELGLPEQTRLGTFETVELPPLGWTHYGVLFLTPVPAPAEILRVWVSPETLRIIQCLYGPKNAQGGAP